MGGDAGQAGDHVEGLGEIVRHPQGRGLLHVAGAVAVGQEITGASAVRASPRRRRSRLRPSIPGIARSIGSRSGSAAQLGQGGEVHRRGSVAVTIHYDAAAGVLHLSVRDTGPGLEADQIPYLFGRFSRADAVKRRRHDGAGLGLAICKGRVEAMGGVIGVESVAGRGTAVAFVIPAPAVTASGTTVH
jgi:signal transduction histidine kinase